MADPISVITLAASIISKCYSYGCTVADAPEEARRLAAEVTNLSGLLVGLQGLSKQHEDYLYSLNLPKILLECSADLKTVEKQLEGLVPAAGQKKTQRIVHRLRWPLKRGDTLKLLEYIERQKNTLSVLLESFTSKIVSDQQDEVQQLSSAVQSLNARIASKEEEDAEQKLLDWVCDYNYQAQHHRACRLHCDNTSSWILDHPTFVEWMKSINSTLWFRGAPGSGKTVLASYIVEHLLQAPASDGHAVVFFYYDKSTNQSLSFQTFLGSVTRQLCVQLGTPQYLKEAFSTAKIASGGLRPISVNQLTSMIRQMIAYGCQSTFIIDGLDEAEDITGICDFLSLSLESKTKFFISSRPHNALADTLADALKMSAPSASASSDIAKYIDQRLNRDQRLRKMNESLKSYMRETLGLKAAGMFRWVQCQLDEISCLRTDKAIKAALKALPETLEASYSRNVMKINEGDISFAYRALLWLTYAMYPLKLDALAETAILEPNTLAIDDESRLSDPTDIIDICGMLAYYNDVSDEVQLSHHSVREFLSTTCKTPFSFPEKQSHRTIAECCILYLLNDDFKSGPFASPDLIELALAKYPLLAYAARTWPAHVLNSDAEEALQPLILKLLTPEPNPNFYSWLQIVLYHSIHAFEVPGSHPSHRPTPLYYACSYGLFYTVKSLISLGADLNVRAGQFGGTAYHAACWRQHPHIVRLLLEASIDTTIRDNNGMTAFDLIEYAGYEDVAEVAMNYESGVTMNYIVDKALGALYSQKQANGSKDKKRREDGASSTAMTDAKFEAQDAQNSIRKPLKTFREVSGGTTFELE